MVCGIDEAGRGPVIGPLVVCGVIIDEKDIPKLEVLGVKDSKLLTPKKRNELFEKIRKIVKADEIIIISPSKIDQAVLSETSNLNWLEADTSAEIINKLNTNKAILDCPSNNIQSYVAHVRKNLKKEVKIIAEHKADAKYPVVAAASILAKVTRDREIETIRKKTGIDFGSGYPSDPKTIDFMKKHCSEHPLICRKSWGTYTRQVNSTKNKKLGDF